MRDLLQRVKALAFNGWISYLDFFLEKNINDFVKPVELAGKIGMVQLAEENKSMNRRSMANGRIQYNAFNTSTYTPYRKTFIPHFTRLYNTIPTTSHTQA